MRKINSFEWKFSVIKELQEYRCCKKSGIPPRSVFLMLKSGLNQHVCRFPFLWAINPCWLAKSPFAGTVPLISRVTANFCRSTHHFYWSNHHFVVTQTHSNFLWVKTYPKTTSGFSEFLLIRFLKNRPRVLRTAPWCCCSPSLDVSGSRGCQSSA